MRVCGGWFPRCHPHGDRVLFISLPVGSANSDLALPNARPSALRRTAGWCACLPAQCLKVFVLPHLSAPHLEPLPYRLAAALNCLPCTRRHVYCGTRCPGEDGRKPASSQPLHPYVKARVLRYQMSRRGWQEARIFTAAAPVRESACTGPRRCTEVTGASPHFHSHRTRT